jgi:hypothetical protein
MTGAAPDKIDAPIETEVARVTEVPTPPLESAFPTPLFR